LRWLREFGVIDRFGVEGTGSYGAGLTRVLFDAGVDVVEVDRGIKDGRTKKEAIRCLKRDVAREVYAALPNSP
jgi:predicted phosphoribosyltransferase